MGAVNRMIDEGDGGLEKGAVDDKCQLPEATFCQHRSVGARGPLDSIGQNLNRKLIWIVSTTIPTLADDHASDRAAGLVAR